MEEEQGAGGGQSSYKLAAQPRGDFCAASGFVHSPNASEGRVRLD